MKKAQRHKDTKFFRISVVILSASEESSVFNLDSSVAPVRPASELARVAGWSLLQNDIINILSVFVVAFESKMLSEFVS